MKFQLLGALVGALLISATCSQVAFAQPTLAHTFSGNNLQEHLGESVSGIGDVNGDGVPDIIVGSPGYHYQFVNPTVGVVRVFSGADYSVIHVISDTVASTSFGFEVRSLPDINGDGIEDIIVGAPADATNGSRAGRVYVFSGADASMLHSKLGSQAGAELGFTVSQAGDYDQDGTPDFMAGIPFFDNSGVNRGKVCIFSGLTGLTIKSLFGPSANSLFGRALSDCGDVNGDGIPDIMIGAPYSGPTLDGEVSIFSGVTSGLIQSFVGTPGSNLGWCLTGLGDLDEDGFDDYAIGSPGIGVSGTDTGFVSVYSGFSGLPIHSSSGQEPAEYFGREVRNAGDVNGDGVTDMIIGSPLSDRFFMDGGRVTVTSGKDSSTLFNYHGQATTANVGVSVAGVGDLNFDGFADLIVGSSAQNGPAVHSGVARLYFAPTLAILKYDTPSGGTDLDLEWTPDTGNVSSLTGTLTCSGATPGGLGVVGLSFAPANFINFGIPILIAGDPTNLIEIGNFGFDLAGQLVAPNVSRQFPFIAGSLVHIQMYESSPVIQSSNGIRMRMVP